MQYLARTYLTKWHVCLKSFVKILSFPTRKKGDSKENRAWSQCLRKCLQIQKHLISGNWQPRPVKQNHHAVSNVKSNFSGYGLVFYRIRIQHLSTEQIRILLSKYCKLVNLSLFYL
jgi:hypothetical protein